MTFTHALATNNYGESKFIVSANAYEGTHTTIAAALTAASSGETIFIRTGTYTENLTLKVGVNLCAFDCDSETPNVTIIGTCTLTTAGTVTISGIRLQTNSAAAIAVTGTLASILNLKNCYLNFTNNDGITFSSSSASALIFIDNCNGNLGTTGIKLFAHSSAGTLVFTFDRFTNTGLSTTASTCSSGVVLASFSNFSSPLSFSSTGSISAHHIEINCTLLNVTALTVGGGTSVIGSTGFSGGTASAISVGTGTTLGLGQCSIQSTNTNAITGLGTLNYSGLDFTDTSGQINTTTQTPLFEGTRRSVTQPAFLAYLPSDDLNKTGAGTSFTIGNATALTEVFDQGSNFNTNGTFTAPVTGRYQLNGLVTVIGTTIATIFVITIVTSNRSYQAQYARNASAANEGVPISVFADMDSGDTSTLTIAVFGEAGDTDDIDGGTNAATSFSGFLVC